jgi:hypothetical protein
MATEPLTTQTNAQILGLGQGRPVAAQNNAQLLGYSQNETQVFQANLQILWCLPVPQTLYCWARQKGNHNIFTVTPVAILPP